MLAVLVLWIGIPGLTLGQEVRYDLRISDGPSQVDLALGFHPLATPGIDHDLGEQELPPLPPSGVLDARWVDVDLQRTGLGQGSLVDIVPTPSGSEGRVDFELYVQQGASGQTKLHWDLPPGASLELEDLFGGSVFSAELVGADSLALPGNLNRLFVKAEVSAGSTGRESPHSTVLTRCYPNPTNGRVRLEGQTLGRVQVFDVSGRQVGSQENGPSLDMTGQPQGLYFLVSPGGACPIVKR